MLQALGAENVCWQVMISFGFLIGRESGVIFCN